MSVIYANTTEHTRTVNMGSLMKTDIDLHAFLMLKGESGEDVVLEYDNEKEKLNRIFVSCNVFGDVHLAETGFTAEEMLIAHPKWKEGVSDTLLLGPMKRVSNGRYIGKLSKDHRHTVNQKEFRIPDDTTFVIDKNVNYIFSYNGKIDECHIIDGFAMKPASRLFEE